MILPDWVIRQLCLTEKMVDPYIEDNLQPASLDVTLGNRFREFQKGEEPVDLKNPIDYTREWVLHPEGGHICIQPGQLMLGVTEERVSIPSDVVARIEGRSSIGRLGLAIHVTAGFIDPGFRGKITLEMVNLSPTPIILRPGKIVAQLCFNGMSGPSANPYDGRYQGDDGPSASRYGQ